MLDLSDVELREPSPTSPAPKPHELWPKAPWIAAAGVVVAVGAAWWFVASRQAEQPVAAPAAAQPATAPAAPRALGGAPQPVELPPLADTDPLVRTLVAALSAHPTVARWLATDGLIRTFVVVVENIAYGPSPARHLPALRPRGPFRTIGGEGEQRIDPRSYERYAPIAAAVDSIDAAGAARLYTLLKPRIEDAYAELGRGESFDMALEQALVAMLRTPAIGGVPLVATTKGIVFAFEDPRLEQLTPAQKQLARMGAANVRIIQNRLRQIGLALGIPPERLG